VDSQDDALEEQPEDINIDVEEVDEGEEDANEDEADEREGKWNSIQSRLILTESITQTLTRPWFTMATNP
jgi:hypothetical protein